LLAHAIVLADEVIEVRPLLREKRLHFGFVFEQVETDRDGREPSVLVFFGKLHRMRKSLDAWQAPRRPHIDKNDFAFVLGDGVVQDLTIRSHQRIACRLGIGCRCRRVLMSRRLAAGCCEKKTNRCPKQSYNHHHVASNTAH
jgi:hypothetical protein